MLVITTTDALAQACAALRQNSFVAIDTEFMRETTYWPKLCLIQAAGGETEVVIDPMAPGLSLDPLLELLADPGVLKVFHAARQDLEIFVRLMGGEMPGPVFDTQVAAMACGYGDQVAYDSLVSGLLKRKVDKSSRFTDWSRRPLSEAQLEYALADVTHLRDLYPKLIAQLEKKGRADWVQSEMASVTDPALFNWNPEDSWERFKPKKHSLDYLAALRAAAAWRERFAQERDIPRGRVLKDDAIYEIAEQRPRDADGFSRLRAVPKGFAGSKGGIELIEALNAAYANAADYAPKIERAPPQPQGLGPTVELLKVLLKYVADHHGVASKLIATVSDLEALAADDDADVDALKGWRLQAFGRHALDLKHGKIALTLHNKRLEIVGPVGE
jgi:ribonuclease D